MHSARLIIPPTSPSDIDGMPFFIHNYTLVDNAFCPPLYNMSENRGAGIAKDSIVCSLPMTSGNVNALAVCCGLGKSDSLYMVRDQDHEQNPLCWAACKYNANSTDINGDIKAIENFASCFRQQLGGKDTTVYPGCIAPIRAASGGRKGADTSITKAGVVVLALSVWQLVGLL